MWVFRLGWGDDGGRTFEKKSPFHKFHFFLQMWLERRVFVWFYFTGQNCTVRLGKSTPVMFAEQFDVERSFLMGLFERFGKDHCEERRVNSGFVSNHCKYWCMIIYTSSIEFDTHGKLLRPAITNSWDLKNKKSSFTAGQGAIKVHDLSRFVGGVEDCSLPHLNLKTPSDLGTKWRNRKPSSTSWILVDLRSVVQGNFLEDKLDLPPAGHHQDDLTFFGSGIPT